MFENSNVCIENIFIQFVDYFITTDDYVKCIFLGLKKTDFNCDLSNTPLYNYGLYSISGHVNIDKLKSLDPTEYYYAFAEVSANVDIGFCEILNNVIGIRYIKIVNIVGNNLSLFKKVIIKNNYRIYTDLSKYDNQIIYGGNSDTMFDFFMKANVNNLNLTYNSQFFEKYGYHIYDINLSMFELEKLNIRFDFIRNHCILINNKAFIHTSLPIKLPNNLNYYKNQISLYQFLNLDFKVENFYLIFTILEERKNRLSLDELNELAYYMLESFTYFLSQYNNITIILKVDMVFYVHTIEYNIRYDNNFKIIK